nr:uncharacterized protein LOC123746708 [Procambarus clarkii]
MADSSPPFQDGGELGQTKCKLPDPLASCHEDSSDQGPALLEDLQERGPMPSKSLSEQGPMLSEDLSEQWEQALSNNALKRDLTLPLQTPIISAVPSISPQLRPDHLVPLDISSSQPSEVASRDSETKSAVNEDAQINTLVSLQQALEEVSEPLELEPSLTSVSSVKIGISEFNKTNPFSLPETSAKVPDKSSSSTEKSIVIAEAMTEMLADSVAFPAKKEGTVGTALPEKQGELAGSEFTTFSAAIAAGEKCSSVVSALTEKSPDETEELTETYEKLLSDISLQSEKILPDDIDPLQKCSVVDVMPSKPCLTLDTVEEPHLLKFSSPSEGELESPLDTREEPASLPIVLFDHPSPLPSVSTDVIFPLPSTKNSSSSVITVDTKLPYSSKQSSETHISTPLMPSLKEKAELTQIGSESSGSQDVQECFNIRSKKQDYVCGTEEGCELNLQADTCISLDEKLESEGASCVNRILDDSSVVNSEQEMQVDESGECWNDVDSSREESAMETMPLIVDTHTLSQDDDEHSTVISNNAVSSHLISSSVLSSPQSNVSNVCTMPLLGTEPLQPVTIGSSLQPLEEVQEASVLDDPSFAADLTLIDSSADEADSIGGLVINSVIGAADGVVDFHPDEEMETDRELTDISASAPQIVEDVCDNDSNDDNGPSAKRMRFENGVSDLDNKAQGTKKVIIRVTPVKNGHGLWDSHKLQEVLLAKGTILLRLHASTDVLEMFETDKDEKEVDFTGIMADSKDEEHDHILGLANLEPDADVYDPLAIVSTHSVDHASPPHYSRPFPHNRGRSTALQPAMSRPGFRHLQSPPHPHYYMKHEVLGLPPPLEFEEPQLGTTDWSGKEYYAGLLLQRKAPTPSQYPAMPPAPPPPPRGRKRGRPPLSSRRGFPPNTPRGSPSKARSQGKRHPEPIKFRPPTPPHHLFLSSLFRLSKSVNFIKNDIKKTAKIGGDSLRRDVFSPVDGKKGAISGKYNERAWEEDDIIVTESQPHIIKHESDDEYIPNPDTSLKRFLIKLPCDFCNLVFRKRSSLLAHLKHKHRGMQQCPICKEKIKVKSKYGMRFHILKNHRDQPHIQCKKCGESFKLQHHLTNHERLKHELMESDDDSEEKRKVVALEKEIAQEKEAIAREEQERKEREKMEGEKKEREEKEKREREKREREKKEREKKEKEKMEQEREREKIEKEKREKEMKERERKAKEEEQRRKKNEQEKRKGEQKKSSKDDNDHKELMDKGASVNGKGKAKCAQSVASFPKGGNVKNVKNLPHGKVMNVRPPSKAAVSKAVTYPPRPPTRVTRSKPQVKLADSEEETKSESESEEEEGDDDDDDDDDTDNDDESTTSSSVSEVEEEKQFSCDICNMSFSHLVKLKHHQKNEHSRATRSQVAAKAQETKEEEDEEDEEDEEEEDEEEEEEEEDEEEEELRKERERKERERKKKEESLTCRVCSKVCRSEYQLNLHMPAHTTTRKGQVVKKPIPSKTTSSAEEKEENKSHTPSDKANSETVRILRSTPQGTGKLTTSDTHEKNKDHLSRSKGTGGENLEKSKDHLTKGKGTGNENLEKNKDQLPRGKGTGGANFEKNKDHLARGKGSGSENHDKNKDHLTRAKGTGGENIEKNKDHVTRGKPDPHKKGAAGTAVTKEKQVPVSKEKYEPPNKDKGEKNERPSFLLKVGSLFRCTKCNITFNREKSMTYHMKKIHETLYPFRGCEHCGKIFRSCGPYNRHVIIHKVHRCPESNCKAKYRKMLRLKQHQKNAHPNKPYRCPRCVSIFAKRSELEKHQAAKHPKVPSEDEDEGSEEEDEEGEEEEEEEEEEVMEEEEEDEDKDEPRNEDKSEDEKKKNEEQDNESDDDDSEEASIVFRRRARCVPISYKEPEDEEDLIPLKKGPDKRKYLDSNSSEKRIVNDKRSIGEKNVSDEKNSEAEKRKRLNNTVEEIEVKIVKVEEQKIEKIEKDKVNDSASLSDATSTEEDASAVEPSAQDMKQGKKTPKKLPSPSNKKVNLSWTAALKAQIQASKSGPKNTSKQKKGKNNSAKVRRKLSTGSGGQNPAQGSELLYGQAGMPQDSLPYPGYLVGEDSMFSLDDSSQMDIMGDYYGAQYPPSEEISDFVPDDDESGPAKIIGFDSF